MGVGRWGTWSGADLRADVENKAAALFSGTSSLSFPSVPT